MTDKLERTMKSILTILAVLGLSGGSAMAGCGIKDTNTGKLKSFDEEAMAIVVSEGDKDVTLTITEATVGKDGLAEMVGQEVKVVSEHGNVDSVESGS